jgi:hypothetical protein
MTKQSALRKIAEGLFEYADAMYEEEQAAAPAVAAPGAVSEPVEDLFPPFEPSGVIPESERVPQGSLEVCPKHREPYMDKGRGKFCPKKTNDPAWANPRGFCKINPDNAAEWLRITAA